MRWKSVFIRVLYARKHWLFVILGAYLVADLLILFIRPTFIPLTHQAPKIRQSKVTNSFSEYKPIADLNIFHNAPIPPSIASTDMVQSANFDGIPVLSGLPLKLNGTIVYKNELYSIAHIDIINNNTSDSYQIGDTIGKLARITKIESDRVYFINLNSNTEEYIQVPDLPQVNLQFRKEKPQSEITNTDNKFVKHLGNNNFQIKRSVINDLFRSLPDVLQQATVVPRWNQNQLVGYEFKYIEAGSPYEKLGFKVSDVIESVNGEKILSAVQATELFLRVKNRSKIDMTILRKGQQIPFSWSINEDVSMAEPSSLR